ncbi:tyrosine-type recombinase/integrase (plasmid) [Rhodococcus sp. NyZ502]|uniref:tyrosine-type recombinase/integrase n=1 Tax=Rhodococcus sp. NyZ502 TaxID=3242855 RepID=UPI003558C982
MTGNDEPTLHWNNIKSKRLGRKLPITRATAAAIGEWQEIRQTLPAPPASSEYLFPAKSSIAREPFIRTHYISRVMRAWVDQIDRLDSDSVDADGIPLPFDRTLVYPYTLRHTYAQRHADAGVPVDVLRDLMDHKHINTTTIYYEITTSRKREAVATVASFTVDRAGRPAPMNDQAAYEVRAVAVPFGNCIEPSTVKAGGGACPVRFQCAGCGFYRPDPSYLTAIEEHINSLKADRETAHAMDVAGFVVENLTAQIDAFTHVHQTMTDQLDTLAPDERARVDEASAVLRKSRAGIAGRSLPLHVIGKNTAT